MRILLSAPSFDPSSGGPAHSVPALAAALAARGMEVALWAPDGSVPAEAPGCSVPGGAIDEAVRRFGRPDLIHDNGIWLPHHHRLALLARREAIPRVVSPRGMLEPWAMRQRRMKKRLAWMLYQHRDLTRAALIHATAGSEAEAVRSLGLVMPLCVVPNGVTMPPPRPGRPPRLPDTPRTALYLGRLHPKKGLPMLLRAWRRAAPAGWRLHIAGPDEQGHAAELRALAETLGITEAVRIEGPVYGAAKTPLFDAADLFVLPTHSENFGLTVAEALAHALPVLTTTGAPWRILAERGCGWWVAPSEDAIEAALREATALPDGTRGAMGIRGHALALEQFGWAGIADQLLAEYRRLLPRA